MPMDGKLTAEQIVAIKDWIDQGAAWDGAPSEPAADRRRPASLEEMTIPPEARKYWAFQKPVRAPVPVVIRASRIRSTLPGKDAPREGAQAGAAGRPHHALAPRLSGPDRAAADARRDGRVPGRHVAGCLGATDRPAARLAALRRALGPALAGRGALRRFQRLRARFRPAQRLALPRLRDPRLQPDSPTTCFLPSRSPATSWIGSPTTA